MIILNPDRVTLGSQELAGVTIVAIDRTARRTAYEWTDIGPHINFADIPEQRTSISIIRRITQTELATPRPGELLALALRISTNASAAESAVISASVVITAVEHSVNASGKATQSIRSVAISATGSGDPITQTQTTGEA